MMVQLFPSVHPFDMMEQPVLAHDYLYSVKYASMKKKKIAKEFPSSHSH